MSSSADNAVTCSEGTNVAKNLIDPKEEKDISDEVQINYKDKYRSLKRKLSSLLYEQECFHEELRKVQKKCLRASRDKSFLLDRLLQYEKPTISSSDDELTDSSIEEKEEVQEKKEIIKTKSKKKNSSQRSSEKPIINTSEKSINKSSEKFKKKSSCVNDVEKERCRHTENGKQCTKLVSTKIKSGICFIHRQQMVDNNISQKKSSVKRAYPPTGGKDIGQIREAMEASSRLGTSTEEEDDELVIDLP